MQGHKLGPYTILEQLGAGGMGEVWLAEDSRLGRRVAIKVLPEEFASDPERLARFEQEARAAAALNHPNIAAVHDVGVEGGTHFMVQEYLTGESLRDALAAGPLPLKRMLSLATEIAEALRAAHRAGIVHRDLKPENVFVTEDGHAKVLDFGLAKLTETAAVGGASQTMSPTVLGTVAGQIMGTAGYMAPEQVEGRPVDRRADLFALGCVVQEMATGTRAFSGRSLHETLHQIGHEPALLLGDIDPGLPADLERAVAKLLEKDPDDRYQHADDVVVDLRRLARAVESGTAARVSAAAASATAQSGKGGGFARQMAGAAIVVAALIAAWFLAPERSGPPVVLHAELSVPGLGFSRNMEGRPLSISADGRVMASHATLGGDDMIAVLRLDTGETQVLDIDALSINEPVVSPDGESIAFVGDALYRMSVSTGAYESVFGFQSVGGRGIVHRGLAWVGDERLLVVRGREILLITLATGEARSVHTSPEGEFIGMPTALPGGRHALLTRTELTGTGNWELVSLDLEAGELAPLSVAGGSPIWVPGGYLAYSVGGQAMVARFDPETRTFTGPPAAIPEPVAIDFTGSLQMHVSDTGTMVYLPVERFRSGRLVWVGRDGSETPFEVEAVNALPALGDPRISTDGERIVVASVFNIYTVDIPGRTATPLATGLAQSFYPIWLGDTMDVLYAAERSRYYEIYAREVDSSAPERLAVGGENPLRPVSWVSAHDQLIVREETPDRAMDLLAVSLSDPDVKTPVLTGPTDEFAAAVSPNGRWIAYTTDETGRDEVWLTTYPSSGRRVQVSQEGGGEAVWAPDSSELYYWSGDRFHAARISAEPQLRVTEREFLFERKYVRYRWHAQYDVHPDGGRFLMVASDDPNANVRIVQNWVSTLDELTAETVR